MRGRCPLFREACSRIGRWGVAPDHRTIRRPGVPVARPHRIATRIVTRISAGAVPFRPRAWGSLVGGGCDAPPGPGVVAYAGFPLPERPSLRRFGESNSARPPAEMREGAPTASDRRPLRPTTFVSKKPQPCRPIQGRPTALIRRGEAKSPPSPRTMRNEPAEPASVQLAPPETVPLAPAAREDVVRILSALLRGASADRPQIVRTRRASSSPELPIGPDPSGTGSSHQRRR